MNTVRVDPKSSANAPDFRRFYAAKIRLLLCEAIIICVMRAIPAWTWRGHSNSVVTSFLRPVDGVTQWPLLVKHQKLKQDVIEKPISCPGQRYADAALLRVYDRGNRCPDRAFARVEDHADGHQPELEPKTDALARWPSVLRNPSDHGLCLFDEVVSTARVARFRVQFSTSPI